MKIERPKSRQPIPDHAKKVFSGVLFDVYQWEQKLFDGTTATFEKIKRADTVIIFPVLKDGRIILTEQEQPGMKPFLGTAGGRVDPGEEIINAAKRELLEETGHEADNFILWEASQSSSKIESVVYTFIAKGCEKIADINLDAGEKINLKYVTFDEFIELVFNNEKFVGQAIIRKILEARLDSKKMIELKELFKI